MNARGGRISTGPANQTLDSPQPLTQGSGTPSDVRPRFHCEMISGAPSFRVMASGYANQNFDYRNDLGAELSI